MTLLASDTIFVSRLTIHFGPEADCSENGAFVIKYRIIVKLRFRSMTAKKNIVGPQVRKLRYQQALSQEMLAARCARFGWDISRATLSKIEAQLRCVVDSELLILANALGVELPDIFPTSKKHAS
jgi:DNA-binding XRE family transcriptional regulator